jgi:hypothetical protein
MKKWIFVLLFLVLIVPLVCQAGVPGFMKERMGTLSGQVVNDAGELLEGGGVVSFFNSDKGIPPLIANMHRIPDMVGRMGPDGKFSVKLLPGSYYMGALIITDPGRGPGPPREGEKFYFVRDDKGNLREFTLALKEEKNVGQVFAASPESFPVVGNLVTIQGRLLKEDSTPFVGGVVLVKSDMDNQRPDFISQRTGKDGEYLLKLPADTSYYLLGRERAVGRPVPGSYVGTYGSNSAISAGGALPIGNVRPAQPASGMPDLPGFSQMVENEQPKPLIGKAGEILTGIDIMMFRVPVPGEQREKLQGTLGFGKQMKQEEGVETKQTGPEPAKNK